LTKSMPYQQIKNSNLDPRFGAQDQNRTFPYSHETDTLKTSSGITTNQLDQYLSDRNMMQSPLKHSLQPRIFQTFSTRRKGIQPGSSFWSRSP
jgi:hypothetical protein